MQVFNSHPIFTNAMAARGVSAASQQQTSTDVFENEDDTHDQNEDRDMGDELEVSSADACEAETIIHRSPLGSPRPLGQQILDPENEGFEDAEQSFADGEYDDRH